MNKRMNKITQLSLIFCFAVSVFVTTTWAQDSTESYALLVQQSPPDAGSVTPGSGVHKVGIGETVSLSAVPKPGYRFLYWLGDVSSTVVSDTTVQIDSPKMVVAVFARDEYEEKLPGLQTAEGAGTSGGGGSGRMYNPVSSAGSTNVGAYYEYDPADVIYNFSSSDEDSSDDDEDDDEEYEFPVPGDGDDIAVPGESGGEVPEPATILILGLGATAFLRRKRI